MVRKKCEWHKLSGRQKVLLAICFAVMVAGLLHCGCEFITRDVSEFLNLVESVVVVRPHGELESANLFLARLLQFALVVAVTIEVVGRLALRIPVPDVRKIQWFVSTLLFGGISGYRLGLAL